MTSEVAPVPVLADPVRGRQDPADPPDLAARVRPLLRAVADFPSPGITFWDLTPLFADPAVLGAVVADLAAGVRDLTGPGGGIDAVAAVEARGFVLGAPLALALGVAFVPVRKAGKLPWRTVREDYALEYGTASVEVHEDAVAPGARVVLVDDVLATGGTAAAAVRLLERVGADVVAVRFLAEITALDGRRALDGRAGPAGRPGTGARPSGPDVAALLPL